MGLDIRLPMGLMFTIFGALLTGYGLLSDRAIYQRSELTSTSGGVWRFLSSGSSCWRLAGAARRRCVRLNPASKGE